MTRRIPQVADGVLQVLDPSGGPEIAVASPSWIAWLTDPATRSFSFQGPSGRYTARKEHRSRGGEYWVAYRKQGGKLHKAYLGKAEDVTLARLEDVAAAIADRGGEDMASPPSDATSGDGGPSRRVDAAATDSHTTVDDQLRERRRQGTSADPLLMTKLAVPSTRVSLVPRPRLSERLEEGLGPQLILVSAPAGFGKSTLLGTWASELSGSGRPMAWYSLDSGDNDPAQFWRYFFTAIDLLQPGSGKTALALLGSPQAPPIESILTTLLNELVGLSTDAVLVIDDYHLIESQTIHEALTFLIDHLPPRMHLAIATRMDPPLPLPRLRARGEMTELRAADLRFTPEEAATFLNRVMGLELTAEDTAELEGRTEGWIAGLQMAALAMQDRADVSGFIAAFAGSNRYVLDYLAEEVLARQPEELQTFLLETSILDRMCAPLCNAVTGRADGQTALERLEHANLFVIPLDDERHWYRYHHLFVDVLRQRLRQEHPDLVSVLHRRACGWFERQGLVGEAINHALAAQDWERAVRLIESNGVTVVLGRQVQTMLGWIDRIPEELARERPALCTIRALALVLSNRPDAAEASLREAERYLGADPTTDQARTILGRAAVTRAAIARSSGDLERCVAMGRRALELLPETESTGRAAARTNAALAYQVSGDVAPANERALEEAIGLVPRLRRPSYAAQEHRLPRAVADAAGAPQGGRCDLRGIGPGGVGTGRIAGHGQQRSLLRGPGRHTPRMERSRLRRKSSETRHRNVYRDFVGRRGGGHARLLITRSFAAGSRPACRCASNAGAVRRSDSPAGLLFAAGRAWGGSTDEARPCPRQPPRCRQLGRSQRARRLRRTQLSSRGAVSYPGACAHRPGTARPDGLLSRRCAGFARSAV